jgi:hypothetical protein
MTMATHYHVVLNGTKFSTRIPEREQAERELKRVVALITSQKRDGGGYEVETVPFGTGQLTSWNPTDAAGWQVTELKECSWDTCTWGRELMTVSAELWALSANADGIWLVSPKYGWRSGPIYADDDPYHVVTRTLNEYGALEAAKIIHSTSWRAEDGSLLLTYVAALDCSNVHRHWAHAELVSHALPEAVGPPIGHAANEPPIPDYAHVLLHAMRHLRFLEDHDATVSAAFSPAWRQHLQEFEPALAGMYSIRHQPEVIHVTTEAPYNLQTGGTTPGDITYA